MIWVQLRLIILFIMMLGGIYDVSFWFIIPAAVVLILIILLKTNKLLVMKRKDYFKEKGWVALFFIVLGVLALNTMDDASMFWQVVFPTFLFGISLGIVLYGFIKYKK